MVSTKKLKERILFEYDMDLVGIAPASALAGEPVGHRPEDLLPGAKSIIVLGRKLIAGAVQAFMRKEEDGNPNGFSSYRAHAKGLAGTSLQMDMVNEIALFLESEYDMVAMPLPFGITQYMIWNEFPNAFFTNPYKQGMPLDIYKAALAAGLGEFGWSNRFVTPEYGPRQNLSAIIVNKELEYDAPYNGPQLCNPAQCKICATMCPTGAISPDLSYSKIKEVVGKKCEVCNINENACAVASVALKKEFVFEYTAREESMGNKGVDLISEEDISDEALKGAFSEKKDEGGTPIHHPNFYCEKCLAYCPIGDWEKTYKKNHLSKK